MAGVSCGLDVSHNAPVSYITVSRRHWREPREEPAACVVPSPHPPLSLSLVCSVGQLNLPLGAMWPHFPHGKNNAYIYDVFESVHTLKVCNEETNIGL